MCSCSFLAGHKGFLSRLCFSRLHLKYSQLLFMLKQSAGINPRIWSNLPSDLKLYKTDAAANIFLMVNVNTHGNGIQSSQYQQNINFLSLSFFSGVVSKTSLKEGKLWIFLYRESVHSSLILYILYIHSVKVTLYLFLSVTY